MHFSPLPLRPSPPFPGTSLARSALRPPLCGGAYERRAAAGTGPGAARPPAAALAASDTGARWRDALRLSAAAGYRRGPPASDGSAAAPVARMPPPPSPVDPRETSGASRAGVRGWEALSPAGAGVPPPVGAVCGSSLGALSPAAVVESGCGSGSGAARSGRCLVAAAAAAAAGELSGGAALLRARHRAG